MASSGKFRPTKVEGYNSTKPELIAIYRLEFYKNKKNWKLCQDVKKEPPHAPSPASSKNLLNETYNIEPELEPENLQQVSPHNQAFLHEEPADDVTDDAIDGVIPVPDPQLHIPPALAPHNLCQHPWLDQSWQGDNSEAVWQDAQQDWCGTESEGAAEQRACEAACPQVTWPTVPPYEQLEPECDPLDYLSPGDLLQLAEEWLQSHGYPLHQEEYAPYYEQYGMLDDSTEFMRGAHGVPHSSEIDLSITEECPRLCSLSARQLAARALAHATALRALLEEHALREKLRYTPSTANLPVPLEEYPTRDTDPPRVPDVLVSGSHRPPDTGRGRGRLRTDRLIGIGMGRPYRL